MKNTLARPQIVWTIIASCAVVGLAGCGGGTPAPDTAEQRAAFRGNPDDPAAIAATQRQAASHPGAPAAGAPPAGAPAGAGAP